MAVTENLLLLLFCSNNLTRHSINQATHGFMAHFVKNLI